MKKHIQKIKEKIDKFGILKLLIVLIAILIIFQAGIFVGYHKAGFYKSMGENCYRTFDKKGKGQHDKGDIMNGIREGGKFMMPDSNIPGGSGAVGKIVSINLPNIVVASPDNIEKTINISNDTLVRQFRENIDVKSLKVGDYIVVIGERGTTSRDGVDNKDENTSASIGVVKAKLIRLLPPPPEGQIENQIN
jgi:hypothetical protein